MDRIQNDLAAAIKNNFKLLGLDVPNPTISCDCTIHGGSSGITAPVTIPSPVAPVQSQFVPGMTSFTATSDMPLSLVDPGNAPFIFPNNLSEEAIVTQQQIDAQSALKVAQDAAARAAQALAPSPVTVTVSAPALSVNTMATNTNVTGTTSATAIDASNALTGISGVSADTGAASFNEVMSNTGTATGAFTTLTVPPVELVERFGGASWNQPGYGLCGKMSLNQILLIALVIIVIAYWVRTRMRRY